MKKPTSKSRTGFTLLEMILVVSLLAILATGAVMTLKGPYQRAHLENAAEQIELMDRQLRDHSRRFQRRGELGIDLGSDTLTVDYFDKAHNTAHTVQLGGGVRIDQFIFGGRRKEYGNVTVPYTPLGTTPTYALRLRVASARPKWLVFIGQTGQSLRIDNEDEIEHLAETMSVERSDAD